MRAPLLQHFAHREHGFAADFEIARNRVEKGLDFLRRLEPGENGKFARAKSEVCGARAAPLAKGGHARCIIAFRLAGIFLKFFPVLTLSACRRRRSRIAATAARLRKSLGGTASPD